MNKRDAIAHLQLQLDQVPVVRDAGRKSPEFVRWHRETAVTIGRVFGDEHENVGHFNQISFVPSIAGSRATTDVFERFFNERLSHAQAVLESMVSEIQRFWPAEGPRRPTADDSSPESDADAHSSNLADVVVICALHKPELDKLFRTSRVDWTRIPTTADDPHVYSRAGVVTDRGTKLQCIAAAPNHMGLTASAVLATKLIWRFRPHLVLMVGIAAGVRRPVQGFGDIIAADQTFDYGAGKLTAQGDTTEFLPDPRPHSVGPRLVSVLREWQRVRTGLDEIQNQWLGKVPATQLRLHVGPLASGAAVLDAKEPVEDILRRWRKLVGVEMEAYGVHSACSEAITPPPVFACFKSVCDFAHEKTDDWQDYAAFTAGSFAWKFIRSEYDQLFPTTTARMIAH